MAILKMTLAGSEIEVSAEMVDTKDVTAQSRCLMTALRYLKQKMKSNTPSTDKIAHAGLDASAYIVRMTSHARDLEKLLHRTITHLDSGIFREPDDAEKLLSEIRDILSNV
jgi:hypothetical protein